MIVPDDKDWTWVLERRCGECGFDAATCDPLGVGRLIQENAQAWERLADAGIVRPGRPDDGTWSALEYGCHVRDVYLRFDGRIALMLSADDPLFANWDQDATAVEDAYESQDPRVVIRALTDAAAALAARLHTVAPEEWGRTGRRSDGARFTVASIARYMIHDPIHHLWDVSPR
ncbi:MAG: DinB family protein [Acidimicrobiales bacterium]